MIRATALLVAVVVAVSWCVMCRVIRAYLQLLVSLSQQCFTFSVVFCQVSVHQHLGFSVVIVTPFSDICPKFSRSRRHSSSSSAALLIHKKTALPIPVLLKYRYRPADALALLAYTITPAGDYRFLRRAVHASIATAVLVLNSAGVSRTSTFPQDPGTST